MHKVRQRLIAHRHFQNFSYQPEAYDITTITCHQTRAADCHMEGSSTNMYAYCFHIEHPELTFVGS